MITPVAGHYRFRLATPSFFSICFHSFQAVFSRLAPAHQARGDGYFAVLPRETLYPSNLVVPAYLLIKDEVQEDGLIFNHTP